MEKRMQILILSAVLSGFSSGPMFAMRRTTSQAARALTTRAGQISKTLVPQVSKMALPAAATRFNSNIVSPGCRWQSPSIKQGSMSRSISTTKLYSPSLQKRWHSTSLRSLSNDADLVQKAVNAAQAGNDHELRVYLAAMRDDGRIDSLQEVYRLTGDPIVEDFISESGALPAQQSVQVADMSREQKIKNALEKAQNDLEISVLKSVSFDIDIKPGFSSGDIAEHIDFERESFDGGGFRNLIREFVETLKSEGIDTVESFIILRDEHFLNFDRLKNVLREKLLKAVELSLNDANLKSKADAQVLIAARRAHSAIAHEVVSKLEGKIITEAEYIYKKSLEAFDKELIKLRARYIRSEETKNEQSRPYTVKESKKVLKEERKVHSAARSVQQQIKPTWSSLKRMPQLSKIAPSASSRMYHTGMFNTDACRIKEERLKAKRKLVVPSLQKRWNSTQNYLWTDNFMIQKAVKSYLEEDGSIFNHTIEFLNEAGNKDAIQAIRNAIQAEINKKGVNVDRESVRLENYLRADNFMIQEAVKSYLEEDGSIYRHTIAFLNEAGNKDAIQAIRNGIRAETNKEDDELE